MKRPRKIRLALGFTAYLNWSFVRSLGELTILTRASFAMLVFVPVLAALWPTVRYWMEFYNEALVKQEGVLQMNLSSLSTDLPSVWVFAFLAALGSLIANLIYQIRAPSIVKKYDENEFIRSEVQNFKEHHSQKLLEDAVASVDGVRSWDDKNETWVYSSHLAGKWEEALSGLDGPSEKLELEYISEHAKSNYGAYARSGSFYSWIASGFYIISLICLVIIITNQTLNVLKQAGWLGN